MISSLHHQVWSWDFRFAVTLFFKTRLFLDRAALSNPCITCHMWRMAFQMWRMLMFSNISKFKIKIFQKTIWIVRFYSHFCIKSLDNTTGGPRHSLIHIWINGTKWLISSQKWAFYLRIQDSRSKTTVRIYRA